MISHDKDLLCITPAAIPVQSVFANGLPGWRVSTVGNLVSAERAIRTLGCRVGLLAGLGPAFDRPSLDRFLNHHWRLLWVALPAPGVVEHEGWRELMRNHLYDFHTAPADLERLGFTLGHAHGIAMLRDHPAAAPAPASAPQHTALTGRSAAITRLRAQVARLARSDAPVLIWGESGAGKEVTAQALHGMSARASGPFVAVNCGAIAPALIHSELFGHSRGAFTGAARDRPGLIESAAGGTIFLDEIADMPKELQANLLRFLQEKTIFRVGSTRSLDVDARVIAASNVNLRQAVADGAFREDLYYRLNVLPVTVPPLRERRDDLPLLAEHFFHAFASERSPHLTGFGSAAMRAMQQHDWPGNVRELINRIRRAMVLAEGRQITPEDLELAAVSAAPGGDCLGEIRVAAERAAIGASLQRAGSNVTRAARELGVSRMTLYRLMSKHGIGSPK